jgi:membrane protease subunit (stomatin/prohibitin family)
MLRDPEFGPLRLRAFGAYAIRAKDAAKLIREIVSTDRHFTVEEITGQLRNLIVTRFSDLLGESKIAALDLASKYDELSAFVLKRIAPEFEEYGLEVTKFLVENISLPPAVEEAIDKRTSMGVIGNLGAYTQFQAANAMEQAARNPGGTAASGMGLGMGFAMAGQMAAAAAPAAAATPAAAPPPLPAAFYVAIGGQQTGPFDAEAIRRQIAAGQVAAATLVWRQGMAAWTAAGQIPELATMFAAVPPPLPPAMP